MGRTALLLSFVLWKTCTSTAHLRADESFSENETKKPSVFVKCQGVLRHGIVSIGGETTGTTLTFHRITWELQFSDNVDREFAAEHHKKSVLVTGTLRKVVGTEKGTRWIIDVEKISVPDSRDAKLENALIAVRGTLRAALSTGDVPDFSVRTEDHFWRLDFSTSRETQAAADLLIGQTVLVRGTVLPPPEEAERKIVNPRVPETLSIQVKRIEASENAKADSRFVE